ncbi:MAG: hypothetical protein ACFWUN_03490 [Pseudolactococcus raffinolactis]|jgi:hypothetical protein|uniref:hypothetical protein n=1 Tax=Pseudolactococcus raffinolactis TaxID=1366 RepID=UPI003A5C52EF
MGIFDIFKRDKQTSPVVENHLPSKINELSEQINFPDIPNWQISISFRKSSSNNFDIALFLAKKVVIIQKHNPAATLFIKLSLSQTHIPTLKHCIS